MIKSIKEWLLNRLDSFWDKRIDVPALDDELHDYVRGITTISTPFMDAVRRQHEEQAKWIENTIETRFKLAQLDRDIEMLRSRVLKAKKQKKRRSDLDKQHQELVRQRLEAEMGSGHGSV